LRTPPSAASYGGSISSSRPNWTPPTAHRDDTAARTPVAATQ